MTKQFLAEVVIAPGWRVVERRGWEAWVLQRSEGSDWVDVTRVVHKRGLYVAIVKHLGRLDRLEPDRVKEIGRLTLGNWA